MAKIHILEQILPDVTSPKVGSYRTAYHVDISGQKNGNLDVSSQYSFAVPSTSPLILGDAIVNLGISDIPTLLSTHPDFGATPESTLLADQDIAEVRASVRYTEGETLGTIAARIDNLYNGIESKTQTEYAARFGEYGTERNPA